MPDIQPSPAISQGDRPEPQWVPADQIIRLNKLIVAQTGEDHGILQESLIASAAARPQNMFLYEGVIDIVRLGVRLIEAIGKNHCFAQGNKRTAFHAGVTFMIANGVEPAIPDSDEAAAVVSDVITGARCASELEALFRGEAPPA